jgi:endonuclease-3
MSPARCRQIFLHLRAANPHPHGELVYRTPFELLIAVILSAQATDKSVNLATRELFKRAPTAQAMLELGYAGLQQYIRTIGLHNAKARNIIATCQLLLENHGGEVPRDRSALEQLPGVGRKTANVVTHVFRVAHRTGLASGASPRAVEDELMRLIPREFLKDAHHWLILLGRYICKARVPECPRCPIVRWCEYKDKTKP